MANDGWNIGYYLTAVDLSDGIRGNVRQLENALPTTKDTEIFVLWDQAKNAVARGKTSSSYPSGGGKQPAWNTTGTAKLIGDASNETIVQTSFKGIDTTEKKNSGTLPIFTEFLDQKIAETTPKRQNALFFGSHGGGLLGGFNTAYVDFSTVKKDANLEIPDLKSALSPRLPKVKYDIIAFDECNMGAIEVAYELKGLTDFVVASQEVVPGDGNNYKKAFDSISGATTPVAFAKQLVTAYTGEYSTNQRNTLSAIEVSKLSELATALKSFSDQCVRITDSSLWKSIGTAARNSTNYEITYLHDLGQFLKNVAKIPSLPSAVAEAAKAAVAALEKSVVAKSTGSEGTKAASSEGLTIILPSTAQELNALLDGDNQATFRDKYRRLAPEFLRDTNWYEFLDVFLDQAEIKSYSTPTATKIAAPDNESRSASRSVVSSVATGNSGAVSSFLSVNKELISLTDDATDLGVEEYDLQALSGILSENLSFQLDSGFGSLGKASLVLVRRTEGNADQILASVSGDSSANLELRLPGNIAIDNNILLQVVAEDELIDYNLKFTLASGIPFVSTRGSTQSTAVDIDSDIFFSGNFLTSQTPEKWFKYTTARTVSKNIENNEPSFENIELYSTSEDGNFSIDIYATDADGVLIADPIADSFGTEYAGATFPLNNASSPSTIS
jgi:hypothetical protein